MSDAKAKPNFYFNEMSRRVDDQVFKLLCDNGKREATHESAMAIYAGALSGVIRFLWLHRTAAATPQVVITKLIHDVGHTVGQMVAKDQHEAS